MCFSNRFKYEEIIEAYDLEILRRPADWGDDSGGDLLLTEDGSPQVGDQIYNAMYRLVDRWSLESPTLQGLFTSAVTSKNEHDRSIASIDELSPVSTVDWDAFAAKFRQTLDQGNAHEFAASIYAAAVVLVLANLLLRFLADLKLNCDEAEKIVAEFDGHSFFAVVRAAANNFRHYEEWTKAKCLDARQKHSIAILADVLSRRLPHSVFEARSRNVCAEVLNVLSGNTSDYEALNKNLFRFVKSAAEARAKPGSS
jgi:hypothetical protein